MYVKNADLGYLGNPQVKRDGVQQKFTEEEISEYLKCMKDPVYFAKTYVNQGHTVKSVITLIALCF
ncbi:MAG: hypothetical protein EB157_04990, partial [Euryarchaeota archaeon]|nr:hypothetical protein [Euryarchaeota archaeon]